MVKAVLSKKRGPGRGSGLVVRAFATRLRGTGERAALIDRLGEYVDQVHIKHLRLLTDAAECWVTTGAGGEPEPDLKVVRSRGA